MNIVIIQTIVFIALIVCIVCLFFKHTRKPGLFGIVAALCLGIGLMTGMGIAKDHVKKEHPVCYEAIYLNK